ncbi:hypothetical protein M6G65_07640 [Methylobacterium tardum]|uniref:hypothetical protein n=1 Tax=Methylobacterium tardum TaxID=374432 RepID=UPI0020220674|nr:hypothetical protein [Methylobacterium tardum]URD38311.1 hypothetical protein M6G65_07640 [Methylobacterium tardum]
MGTTARIVRGERLGRRRIQGIGDDHVGGGEDRGGRIPEQPAIEVQNRADSPVRAGRLRRRGGAEGIAEHAREMRVQAIRAVAGQQRASGIGQPVQGSLDVAGLQADLALREQAGALAGQFRAEIQAGEARRREVDADHDEALIGEGAEKIRVLACATAPAVGIDERRQGARHRAGRQPDMDPEPAGRTGLLVREPRTHDVRGEIRFSPRTGDASDQRAFQEQRQGRQQQRPAPAIAPGPADAHRSSSDRR